MRLIAVLGQFDPTMLDAGPGYVRQTKRGEEKLWLKRGSGDSLMYDIIWEREERP